MIRISYLTQTGFSALEKHAYQSTSPRNKLPKVIFRQLLLLICLAVVGCAHHSLPTTDQPNRVVGRTMEVWVDQDGTFYPSKWPDTFRRPSAFHRGAYSLKRIAGKDTDKQKILEQGEKAALAEYRRYISDKKRIFILVHGFNNSEADADRPYELIKKAIDLEQGDGVVEFYWDGLRGTAAGVPKIWFNAVGYSQLAGTKGLRKLLNVTYGKEIIFITHSRGASVFFSALSDPPYSRGFVDATEADAERLGVHPRFRVYGDPPLHSNSNKISAIVLAPAIGRIDLTRPKYTCGYPMRKFDGQLKLVHFSVNPGDKTLKKALNIPGRFNSTEMGLIKTVADATVKVDRRFMYKVWNPPMTSHRFLHYVGDEQHPRDLNPQFAEMLRTVNVKVKSFDVGTESE